ncbi:MAG: DUF1109 domain-containing protein [Proteobacteria bacterium]|nr:DUF1109 domain-containing protein [Pseudomonadota bacterium]
MHTDELLTLLSSQAPEARGDYLRTVRVVLATTLMVSILVIAVTIGLRTDLVSGFFSDPNRVFKYGFAAVMMVASGLAWWRSGQPGRSTTGPLMFVALFCGWLLILCVSSFYTHDFEVLRTQIMDPKGKLCSMIIFGLGVPILFVLMRLNRALAPVDVRMHGYLTALFSSSIAMFAFSLHCAHDHPLYIALWYAGTVVLAVAVEGRIAMRKARW